MTAPSERIGAVEKLQTGGETLVDEPSGDQPSGKYPTRARFCTASDLESHSRERPAGRGQRVILDRTASRG